MNKTLTLDNSTIDQWILEPNQSYLISTESVLQVFVEQDATENDHVLLWVPRWHHSDEEVSLLTPKTTNAKEAFAQLLEMLDGNPDNVDVYREVALYLINCKIVVTYNCSHLDRNLDENMKFNFTERMIPISECF